MKERKVPQRMCVACRKMKEKADLIRVVCTPEGVAEVDGSGKKSGRGAYLCADRKCVLNAQKTKKLERSFSQASCTSAYAQLLQMTETEDA